MFESRRLLWQHFAVDIVAVLVIMSLSSVNANNENDQCMISTFVPSLSFHSEVGHKH